MKKTIKKVKNYNFGGGVKRDTYFLNVFDEYGCKIYTTIAGFTKEEAIETKNNFSFY